MAIRLLSSESIAGDIDVTLSKNGITYLAVTNTNTGVSANARVQVAGESSQLDLIATSAGYTGVSGWADSGIISTDSGASGGLKLNSQAGGIQLQSGTATHVTMNSSGNVGIGNTSPGDFLSWQKQLVVGNGSYDAGITIYHGSGGGNQGAIVFADGNTGTDRYRGIISYNGADEMKFFTSTLERIKINDAGNVFISTPITNAFYGLSLTYNNTNTADFTVNQATGQIKIGGVATGYFPTFYSGGSERMRIDSSGNVGIGVTDPDSRLEIKGAGATTGLTFKTTDSSGNTGFWAMDGGATGVHYYPLLVNHDYNDTPASSCIFHAKGTTDVGLFVKHDGKVGIGTTSPESLLHIKGETRAYITFQDTSDGFIGFIGDAPNMLTGGTVDNLGLRGEGGIQFGVSDVIKMVLNSSGNVGIGTTSPLEKLNIVETTATAGTFFPVAISGARYQADYGVGIAFRPENNSSSYANKTAIVGSGGGYGYNMADLHFCFNNSTTITDEVSLSDAKVTMKRSGNVGIGDTNPASKLVVAGRVQANSGSEPWAFVSNPTSGNYGGFLIQYNNVTQGACYYNSSSIIIGSEAAIPLRISAGGQYAMHIDASNRNVHIGSTTNATYKLAVNGTFYAAGNSTFAGSITIDNGTSSTLIIEKDATGGGKVQFNDAGSQQAYISLDAAEDMTFYAAANNDQVFYAGGVLNETKSGTTSTFAGNVLLGSGSTIYADLEVKRAGEVTVALHNSSAITSGARGNLAFYNSSVSTVATIRAAADTDNVGTALEFYTRPVGGALTNSMTIDSSGNVGIGTDTIPAYWSGYTALQLGVDNSIFSNTDTGTGSALFIGQNLYNDGSNYKYTGVSNNEGSLIDMRSGIISFLNAPAGTGTATLTERMRITSAGNVDIANTTIGNAGTRIWGGSDGGIIYMYRPINQGTQVMRFYVGSTSVGYIGTSNSGAAFTSNSDYRLKENVVELTGALDRISELKPSRFNFIVEPNKTVDGFLAHEVQDIVPEAVFGEKDAVDEEGNPDYQAMEQSKLVPLLVAAVQELEARVKELENK